MTYLAILVLMLLAFMLVGWPLVGSSRTATSEADGSSSWEDLISQRDTTYRAIQELDFEYQLGNLSDGDYKTLRERYRTQAAAILQRLDAVIKAIGGGERSAGGPADSAAVAASVSHRAKSPCPSCGQPTEATDRYCWSCGAQLGCRCPACGASGQAGDRFCVSCGTRLEAVA